MHYQVILFDGFDPLDVLAPFEILSTAGSFSDGGITVELAAADGPGPVPSGFDGIALTATTAIDLDRTDVLVVPGAAGAITLDPDVPGGIGALLRAAVESLSEILAEALSGRATVATVCGGSLVVAYAGLASGRPLVTHDNGADLEGTGAIPNPARIVDDGDLISSGLVTSSIDLALHLVERDLGPQLTCSIETLLRHERRGTAWRSGRAA